MDPSKLYNVSVLAGIMWETSQVNPCQILDRMMDVLSEGPVSYEQATLLLGAQWSTYRQVIRVPTCV